LEEVDNAILVSDVIGSVIVTRSASLVPAG
jgi:hypothetical protein